MYEIGTLLFVIFIITLTMFIWGLFKEIPKEAEPNRLRGAVLIALVGGSGVGGIYIIFWLIECGFSTVCY